MKGRCGALVGVFCIAVLFASVANAGKPDKRDKPPKPGNTKTECIIFTEDLVGGELVEGCCPNRGPFPPYSMTLYIEGVPDGTYQGHVFMNFFGTGPNAGYKVQFWTWDGVNENPGGGDYFFEIIGGDVDYDKKTKFLRVTFTDAEATVWEYFDVTSECDPCFNEIPISDVSFVLERTPDLSYCEE